MKNRVTNMRDSSRGNSNSTATTERGGRRERSFSIFPIARCSIVSMSGSENAGSAVVGFFYIYIPSPF